MNLEIRRNELQLQLNSSLLTALNITEPVTIRHTIHTLICHLASSLYTIGLRQNS